MANEVNEGDLIQIGDSWCLVYRDRQTNLLHNIILTNDLDVGIQGKICGDRLQKYRPLCNIVHILGKVQHET